MKRLVAFLTCAAAAVVALLVLSPPTHGQGQSGPNGDITAVRTGSASGLEGGAERGVADLSLRTDCSSGSGVSWDGDSWECAAIGGASYTAGDGLTLTGSDFDVVVGDGLEIISDTVSITNDCSDGQVLKSASSGTQWNCANDTDTNTTYTAGTNSLSLTSTTFTITDRDFGDITVGSTGTTMTIDNSSVASAKLNITTTSCSAGQHVSAISSGGVGTCTADSGVTGSGTTNTIAKWTSSSAIGNSIITDSGTTVTVGGNLIGSTIQSNAWIQSTGGIYAGPSSNVGLLSNGSIYGGYATDGTFNLKINPVGYLESTTQTRDVTIYDGTGTASGDTIAFFNGTNREVTFYGPTVYFENSTLLGNSNDDNTSAYGRQYRLGTAPTLSGCTSVCTLASYSTDATGTITCTDGPNACTVTYTQACATNASSCVVSGTDTGGTYLTSAPTTSAFTVSTTSAGAKTVTYHCECML